MTQLRLSPSGPIIKGDNNNDVLIWNEGTQEWEPGPQSGGGSTPEPIQQVRWLDATSAATPNGSIAAPFIDPADFFAEVTAGGGWALMLPAFDAGDFIIPDLAGVPVALVGVMQTASRIGSIPIAAQGGGEPPVPLELTLRDLTSGTLTFNGGPLELVAESCTLGQVEASGTVTGSVRFVNCTIQQLNFPDADMDWQGCTIGRDDGGLTTIVIGSGTFRDCRFLNHVTMQISGSGGGGGGIALYDCRFGAQFVIQCASSDAITCDPVSYQNLVDANPSFPDTTPQLIQKPVVLYQQQIGLVNGAVIPAATITDFNLGQMVDPPALPGGLAQVSFHGDAGSRVVCVGATIDGSGNVHVRVLNTSDTLTQEVLNDQPFDVFYQPAELL